MTPQTLAAIRILALVAAYRERFGDIAVCQLVIDLGQVATRARRPDTCLLCGEILTQRRTGRPRKYCPNCAKQLGHRLPCGRGGFDFSQSIIDGGSDERF